ncbi:MAG: amino acid transporter, partial [Bifidobacterium mongoliense]|nr:amino acid transporter [Bifidobacterium mongoliense]
MTTGVAGDRKGTGVAGSSDLRSVASLDQDNKLDRGLSARHVQFIAIGGTIGPGLFLGAGKSNRLIRPGLL